MPENTDASASKPRGLTPIGSLGKDTARPVKEISSLPLVHELHRIEDTTGSKESGLEMLQPVLTEARTILSQFPQETAIEVANAVLIESHAGETQIPWVTVFPSDDKRHVGERLLKALQTSDYRTPVYDTKTKVAVGQIKELLAHHKLIGMGSTNAAYHIVRAMAGKETEHFTTYQDLGREFPQYATTWLRQLREQFGDEGYAEITQEYPELTRLSQETEKAAELHYVQQGEMQHEGEDPANTAKRALEFLPDEPSATDIDNLRTLNRSLQAGFQNYRSAAYAIRGLPDPTTR